MEKVTILPITPGKHSSFKTLLGILIADVISRTTFRPLEIVLNTTHSFNAYSKNVLPYLTQLKKLGIKPSVVHDDNTEKYFNHLKQTLNILESKGLIKFEKRQMVWCNCGAVELPLSVLELQITESRTKLTQNNKCIKCKGDIYQGEEEVLIMNFPDKILTTYIQPKMYKNEFTQIKERIHNHPLIISRNHRPGKQISVFNKPVTLDSDFCWTTYLKYLTKANDNIVIVAGSDTLNHSAKAICFLNAIEPTVKISIIIHPLIEIEDGRISISNLDINSYLDLCKTAPVAKTFLMLGAQWSQMKCKINSQELHLVKSSVNPQQILNLKEDKTKIKLERFTHDVSRSTITHLLKILRSYQTELTFSQMQLKNALLNIEGGDYEKVNPCKRG